MAEAGRPGGAGARRPPPPPEKPGRSLLGTLVYWAVVLAIWAAIFLVAFVLVFSRGLPDTSKLYDIHRQPSISYLDRNGALLSVRGSQYAPPVDIDSLPAYVPAAFVSVEDRRFYQHWGFDPIGIVRALVADIRRRHTAEGASTITQQLARNLFLTPDQNIKRKIQEVILAVELERQYSKKQILALYLNRVYFGAGAYGIESASETFFNKPASKLTVGEAALLAALLKSPTHYSPVNQQERAGLRATIVLDKMVETHAITPEQRDEALAHPVRVSPALATQHAQYFVDWVDAQVRKLVGQPTTDLIVETTLDLPMDTAAEASARAVVARNAHLGVQQAAVVAMDGGGRIRALIGGVNYADSQFDRAVDAYRQAGSAWKPFVYLTALEQGRTPQTVMNDEPVTIDGWSPHNFEPGYLGPVTLADALQRSLNTVATELADQVGRGNVADTARKLGITTPINTDPAMALGTSLVSPLEMATAYDAFANGGARVQPYAIERIRTRDGQVLYQHHDTARDEVIPEPQLDELNGMLRRVLVPPGTGVRAAIPGYDLAGKTGTTSDFRDAWFVGYTGGFVTAVWVGKDDNAPMHHVTGGSAPADLWRGFMTAALPQLKVQPIPGGQTPAPPESEDPVGDLLNSTSGLSQGAPNDGDGDGDGGGVTTVGRPAPPAGDQDPYGDRTDGGGYPPSPPPARRATSINLGLAPATMHPRPSSGAYLKRRLESILSPAEPSPASRLSRRGVLACAMGAAATAGASRAWAATPASVVFQVWRNNKQIGEHSVRVSGTPGDLTAVIEAHFVVSVGPIPVFRYRHAATEVWQGGRFARLDAQTTSNGRLEKLRAVRSTAGVAIAVGDAAPVMAPPDTAPLTHWNRKALDGALFNPQNGKLMPREHVQALGLKPVMLADGRMVDADAFALTGEAQITDWYDLADTWTGLRAKVMDGSSVDYRRVG